jgi:hypothetical protein
MGTAAKHPFPVRKSLLSYTLWMIKSIFTIHIYRGLSQDNPSGAGIFVYVIVIVIDSVIVIVIDSDSVIDSVIGFSGFFWVMSRFFWVMSRFFWVMSRLFWVMSGLF